MITPSNLKIKRRFCITNYFAYNVSDHHICVPLHLIQVCLCMGSMLNWIECFEDDKLEKLIWSTVARSSV